MSRLGTAPAIALITAVALACGPAGDRRPTSPPAAEARLLHGLQASWQSVSDGAGGFRHLDGWDEASSLYATSWNLCLARRLGIAVPGLSTDSAARWLDDALAQASPPAGLPRLEQALLAAQGLRSLGRVPAPGPVADVLAGSRAGDLYAYWAAPGPTWAATATAVDLMAAAGVRPPPELARGALGALQGRWSDDAGTALALWRVADALLSRADRAALRAPLQRLLLDVLGRSSPPAAFNGVSASVIADVYAIAADNDVRLPAAAGLPWRQLETPNGYLSLTPGAPDDDPQVTCRAAGLGWPAPAALTRTLARTVRPGGWAEWNASLPDPRSSFYGLLLSRALGDDSPEPPLRRLVQQWLGAAAQQAGARQPGLSVSDLYFLLALAGEVRLQPSPELAASLADLVAGPADPGGDAAWRLGLAALLPGRPLPPALRHWLDALPGSTMPEAWFLHVGGRAWGNRGWEQTSLQTATRLGEGDSYRLSTGSPILDLPSAAAALLITDASAARREAGTRSFATAWGYCAWPIAGTRTNRCDPETTYLALLALGRIGDDSGLLPAAVRLSAHPA